MIETIQLDREKRLILLRWLKQSVITVHDMPELTHLIKIEVIDSREQVRNKTGFDDEADN